MDSSALNRLVLVRVEHFPCGLDALHAMLGDPVPELLADHRDALAIFFVCRIVMRLQRAIEGIQHRNQIEDQPLDAATAFFLAIALGPLSEILEIGLPADHGLHQLFLLSPEFLKFRGQRSFAACRRIDG